MTFRSRSSIRSQLPRPVRREDRDAIAAVFNGGLLIGVLFFAVAMAETVAICAPRQRRPMLVLFGSLIAVEVALGVAFLV